MMENPSEFKGFSVNNGLLCHSIDSGTHLLVIPDMDHKGEGVRSLLIENTHKIVGHYSHTKTLNYIQKYYWWPTMAKDVEHFCASCETCQMMKQWTLKPHGLLHNLPIPDCPWS